MLYHSIRQTNQAIMRSNFAINEVAGGIADLRMVAFDYIVNQSERAKQQWQDRYPSLTGILNRKMYGDDDTKEQVLLNKIKQRHRYLQEAFSVLAEMNRETQQSTEAMGISQDVERRVVTQIMSMTHASVSDARQLMKISLERIIEAQQRTNILVISLVALIGLMITFNYAMVLHQVLVPIRKLEQATRTFANGDLSFRTGVTVRNELGVLARAFDHMAERLTDTMSQIERKSALLQDTNRELESFSYSVSHDLRSPLRGIDGWSLALVEDYGAVLDATAQDYLNQIRSEAQRMGYLIDDLLQLARITRTKMRSEYIDLSTLAQKIAARLQASHPARTLEFFITSGMHCEGDSHLLEIMLTNLFDNACKLTGTRARACIEFGTEMTCEVGNPESHRTYFVRDNGVGFDMAHAQKLFGAFQRFHVATEFPGSGIGLATVQRIVHRHGGRIWAKTMLDQGATFYFIIPAAALPTPAANNLGEEMS